MSIKFKAALFYNDVIVFYSLYKIGENIFKAKLESTDVAVDPPELLELYKEADEWRSACENQDLIKELGAAIEQQKNKPMAFQNLNQAIQL